MLRLKSFQTKKKEESTIVYVLMTTIICLNKKKKTTTKTKTIRMLITIVNQERKMKIVAESQTVIKVFTLTYILTVPPMKKVTSILEKISNKVLGNTP